MIEAAGMYYSSGKVGLCIEYIKSHKIADDNNLYLYCVSLYYNIQSLTRKDNTMGMTIKQRKQYKQNIKETYEKIIKGKNE
jgi:hypothetical protein